MVSQARNWNFLGAIFGFRRCVVKWAYVLKISPKSVKIFVLSLHQESEDGLHSLKIKQALFTRLHHLCGGIKGLHPFEIFRKDFGISYPIFILPLNRYRSA